MNKNRPLWAPWRIEYILSDKNGKCFLCDREKESSTEDDYMVVHRGVKAFIMLNAFPYTSGHVLIAPYRHTSDMSSLEDDLLLEISKLMVLSKEVLTDVMKPDGFNIGYNLGSSAGAGLEDHLHLHIVPRWNGDTNFMSVLANSRVIPQALLDTSKILRDAFLMKSPKYKNI